MEEQRYDQHLRIHLHFLVSEPHCLAVMMKLKLVMMLIVILIMVTVIIKKKK
jgi:hypothetical protein